MALAYRANQSTARTVRINNRMIWASAVFIITASACTDGSTVAPATTVTPVTSTTLASKTPAPNPGSLAEAGVESTIRLSQIDTRDDGFWIDGLSTNFQTLYLSVDLDDDRVFGGSERCPGVEGDTWIDERTGLNGVIHFDDLGEVDTTYDIHAVYSSDTAIGRPQCMYIAGTYAGTTGDVASTAGTYSIAWGLSLDVNEITFDGG